MSGEIGVWWEPFDLAERNAVECAIGPLTLWLARMPDAWLVAHTHEAGETAARSFRRAADDTDREGAARFAFAAAPAVVTLRPQLADRPVVVSPRAAVSIPPGERTTFYISTPVWVSVEVGEARLVLCDLPSVRMSDTWFGPNTREGDLCYSTPTHARSRLDEVPRRSHRAITPVEVRNESSEMLPVSRLSLPVPQLSVYGLTDGTLWTQAVTLVHRSKEELADFEIAERAPEPAARRLGAPRVEPAKGVLVRAFSSIFGRED